MPDQAEKLRRMVAEEAPRAAEAAPAPPMIVVTGGKGGVGTTTVAMNLAAALADGGRRVVLVDAARHHADLAELAGIHCCGGTFSDVLAGKSHAVDALVPGPAGTLLLADRWGTKSNCSFSSAVQQRILNELDSLGDITDVVVVDTGSGASQWTERFWQHAQLVIVTSTCDDVAIMDAYATVKLGAAKAIDAELRFLVNQCGQEREVAEVECRFASACQRFLGRRVNALPALPLQTVDDTDSRENNVPRVWESPNTPFGHAVLWLASAVSELLERDLASALVPVLASKISFRKNPLKPPGRSCR